MTSTPSEPRQPGPPHQRRPFCATATRWGLAVLVAVLGVVGPSAGPASPAPLDLERERGGTVSGDGLSATDGQRTLRLARSQGLASAGQTVAVAGSGYDVAKGIYVALCLVTPADQPPSPCGGGIDIDGTSGASAWISSNPPSYGEGLAQPYGDGGTFSVSVQVSATLAGGFDCRRVQCAIVTRNDHLRTADRSQDVIVPVTFSDGPAESVPPPTTGPTTTLAPPPAPTTTTPPPAPEVTLSDDGLTATDGARTLTLSAIDLDAEGEVLTVEGAGFDETRGVLITLCRVAASRTEGAAPCRAGTTPDASVWVSSSPPDHAVDLVTPFDEGGTFSVELEVAPVIDDATDCREVECAVVVRRDDVAPEDRTLDIAIPVTFTDVEHAATTSTTEARDARPVPVDEDDEGATSPLVWVGLAGGAAAVVAVAVIAVRRKGRAGAVA